MWHIFQILIFCAKFPEISNISIENPIGIFQNFENSGNFGKYSFFPENISHFFTFGDDFFMNFQIFWCSVKRRCPLLIRILYLFMKCASKCSIIEIYRNGTKKVWLVEYFRSTSSFPVSCSYRFELLIVWFSAEGRKFLKICTCSYRFVLAKIVRSVANL